MSSHDMVMSGSGSGSGLGSGSGDTFIPSSGGENISSSSLPVLENKRSSNTNVYGGYDRKNTAKTNGRKNGGNIHRTKRNVATTARQLAEAMFPILQSINLAIELFGDEVWLTVGDAAWVSNVLQPTMDDNSEAGVLISKKELSTILSAPLPNGTTAQMVETLVKRMNNTLHGWNSGQLEPTNGSNIASFSKTEEFLQQIYHYDDVAKSRGYSSYIDAYNFARSEVAKIDRLEDEAGVCAVVRIRIEQEVVVTRVAFLAKLEIESTESSSLQQVSLEILIVDSDTGEHSTHLFAISNETLSGSLTASDRGWILPSETSGSVEWLIIPYSEAAPDSDRAYDVGGTLRYLLDGVNVTIHLLPTLITVTPDPSLLVHYFWEKYVIGDDPFTDEIEDSVPFTLGVAVKNAGYGTASNLQITSGQPEIIENEKGLLVNFQIIGALIGNATVINPSLKFNFGDLLPGATKVVRWKIISSLQGEFTNYNATFENINPLGDPNLSILDELEIHELIKDVRIYGSVEEDDVQDFLVNEVNDFLAYPDALYSSKSLKYYNVSVGTVLSLHSIATNLLEVRTVSNNTGWVYYRYEDTQGLLRKIAFALNVTKLNGAGSVSIPSENSWITKDRSSNNDNFYIHILDNITSMDEVIFEINMCDTDCPTVEMSYARSPTGIFKLCYCMYKSILSYYAMWFIIYI